MTTLTPEQLARIRRQSGDASDPYDLSNQDIQTIYDDVDLGNSNLDRTTYYVIRDRAALAATDILSLSDSGTGMSYSNAKYNNLSKWLAFWGDIAGIVVTPGSPGLTVGGINLGIDSTCDNIASDWREW